MFVLIVAAMLYLISFHVAWLSPVQCPTLRLDPMNVLLLMMGLLLFLNNLSNVFLVAIQFPPCAHKDYEHCNGTLLLAPLLGKWFWTAGSCLWFGWCIVGAPYGRPDHKVWRLVHIDPDPVVRNFIMVGFHLIVPVFVNFGFWIGWSRDSRQSLKRANRELEWRLSIL